MDCGQVAMALSQLPFRTRNIKYPASQMATAIMVTEMQPISRECLRKQEPLCRKFNQTGRKQGDLVCFLSL